MSALVKIQSNNLDGKGILNIISDTPMQKVSLSVIDKNEREYAFFYACDSKELTETFYIENPLLWSVNSPNLYRYSLKILSENGEEELAGHFGFRMLSTNGREICLNGTPVYIRGYIRGTTAHDHQNNAHLTDEEFYRKNILAAKKFGFNYVRFHSVVPDQLFFKVADELGMMVHIELRPPHDIYNNLEEMLTTGSAIVPQDFLRQVVNTLYNHPSLTVYCIGNEIKNLGNDGVGEIYERLKSLDNTRLFLDTCAWGANNRPYVDFDVQHLSYYFPFGKHDTMYEDTDNLLVVGNAENMPMTSEGENSSVLRSLYFKVPLIAHEVCHYTALRDFKGLKKKFEQYGTPCPWWIDEELKMIETKGFSENYDEMYKASKHFQRECWKTAYEAMRTSKLLGGFNFLQFADTDVYENSNGIVDCFDDENYIESKEFLKFNGDRVLVAKLGNRLFYNGEEITVPVAFSNCGEDKQQFADFFMSLTDEKGIEYASCAMKNIDVSRKGLYDICKVKLHLPNVKASQRFILKVSLNIGKSVYAENEWNIWLYEKKSLPSYAEFTAYDDGQVCITDDIETALDGLSAGKKVCLIYRSSWTRHVQNKSQTPPRYALKATWNRFKPVIWDRGTNYGGLCNKSLLEKYGFATGAYYDFNYNVLTEDCDKVVLDDFPCEVRSIISGTDKSCRDRFDAYKGSFNLPELMYDRTLRNFSYLFECRVGKGNLLVCGLNMTGLDEKEPSTVAMADFILRYLQSVDFAPRGNISIDDLKAYMQVCAKQPIKERMMTQFWQLDDAPVESKQYWIDSRAYLTESDNNEK